MANEEEVDRTHDEQITKALVDDIVKNVCEHALKELTQQRPAGSGEFIFLDENGELLQPPYPEEGSVTHHVMSSLGKLRAEGSIVKGDEEPAPFSIQLVSPYRTAAESMFNLLTPFAAMVEINAIARITYQRLGRRGFSRRRIKAVIKKQYVERMEQWQKRRDAHPLSRGIKTDVIGHGLRRIAKSLKPLFQRKVFNHHYLHKGIWVDYDGRQYKDVYDIQLVSGEIVRECYPNGGAFHPRGNPSVYGEQAIQGHYEAVDVKRIRLVPDDELTHSTFTGESRDARNAERFGDLAPKYITAKDGRLIAWL